MKSFKQLITLALSLIMMMSFSQCASNKQLQEEAPLEFGKVSYQSWVAGIEGGGSGVNLFIPVESNKNNIVLDSVYFRGKQVKLEQKNNTFFVGRFKTSTNQKKDFIMSNEPYAEYGNEVPKIPNKSPFELNDDECIVSYQKDNKLKYYKITHITKKESQYYPSTPNRKL